MANETLSHSNSNVVFDHGPKFIYYHFFRRLVALIKAENWVDICQESSGNKCCAQDDTGMFFVMDYSFFHRLLFFLHCRNGN